MTLQLSLAKVPVRRFSKAEEQQNAPNTVEPSFGNISQKQRIIRQTKEFLSSMAKQQASPFKFRILKVQPIVIKKNEEVKGEGPDAFKEEEEIAFVSLDFSRTNYDLQKVHSTLEIIKKWGKSHKLFTVCNCNVSNAMLIAMSAHNRKKATQAICAVLPPVSEKIRKELDLSPHVPFFHSELKDGKAPNCPLEYSVNFLHSPLKRKHINQIVEALKSSPEYRKTFTLEILPPGREVVHNIISKIAKRLREEPRTSPKTANADGILIDATYHRHSKNKGEEFKIDLYLNFSKAPLNRDEIQWVLWQVIHHPRYNSLFNINRIDVKGFTVDTLLNSREKNKQFEEVDGDTIGFALHHTISYLNLSESTLDQSTLTYLKKFPALRCLHLDGCIQADKINPITPEAIKAAFPKLKVLSMRQYEETEGS